MKPRKITTVRYTDSEGKRCKAETPGAVKTTEVSHNYFARITLPDGKRKSVPLCSDYARSKQMLSKLEADKASEQHGIGDPYRVPNSRSLGDHLDDWGRALTAEACSAAHVKQTVGRARKVFDACEFTSIRDINALAVQEYIAELMASGRSIQTGNFYAKACQQFSTWLVRNDRAASSKLVNLTLGNVALDRRHDRRELSPEELTLILAFTETAPTRRGLSGADRAMLYRVGLGTGLRAMELASLTARSFRLEGKTPTVTIEATHAKNGEEVALPLSSDLTTRLRVFLSGRPKDEPLWPGKWAIDFAAGKMFRRDLADTRAAWIAGSQGDSEGDFLAYEDSRGCYADFHALRHTYITGIVRSGASPAVCQFLARHASIVTTMAHYSHLSLFDVSGAVQGLPTYAPAVPAALVATGS